MRRGKEEDEVEQLLQVAQDEMILKLSVDSHTSRSYPDYIDPDLNSRFLALKSKPSARKNDQHREKRRPKSPTKVSKDVEEKPDDLMLRFAALKTSLPSASSSSVSPSDEIEEDDDEVEKLIQWAIDAARLDPSPPSDDESCDSDDENDSTTNVKP